jgi:hypothetical protein
MILPPRAVKPFGLGDPVGRKDELRFEQQRDGLRTLGSLG